MVDKIKELKELEQYKKEIDSEIESLKDEIKKEMDSLGTDEYKTDLFTVRYKLVKSKRFDNKSFKLSHKDLYEAFSKESITKRFSIFIETMRVCFIKQTSNALIVFCISIAHLISISHIIFLSLQLDIQY